MGHCHVVQCGPLDSSHLPGVNNIQLAMQGKYGEVQVGIEVELHERAR